jgi:hypothetical protein
VHEPTRVGVGDELVAGLEDIAHGPDALYVVLGPAADLQLEAAIAFIEVAGDVLGHL